jgi:hypothetical protein
MGLAGLLARGIAGSIKAVCAAGIAVAVTGVVMSQSRGGLITIPIILLTAAIWGVAQWPQEVRRNMRMIAASSALLVFIVLLQLGGRHIERFASYGGHWGRDGREKLEYREQAAEEEEIKGTAEVIVLKSEAVLDALSRTCRGRMYGAAWRAWTSAPWFGIGPGMHQNLWPQFAATADGDRERGVWPTLVNDYFHSYEVHSDWLQLLEEYGIAGIILFVLPAGFILFFLFAGIRQEKGLWQNDDDAATEDEARYVYILSAILALTAMGVHSLGDFNLQMPATVWVLAVISALGLCGVSQR